MYLGWLWLWGVPISAVIVIIIRILRHPATELDVDRQYRQDAPEPLADLNESMSRIEDAILLAEARKPLPRQMLRTFKTRHGKKRHAVLDEGSTSCISYCGVHVETARVKGKDEVTCRGCLKSIESRGDGLPAELENEDIKPVVKRSHWDRIEDNDF